MADTTRPGGESARIVSKKAYGVLDYLTGAALLAILKVLGLADMPSSSRAFKLAGGGTIAYSLLTDYELGVAKLLPMPIHLALDPTSGASLASSPWPQCSSSRRN